MAVRRAKEANSEPRATGHAHTQDRTTATHAHIKNVHLTSPTRKDIRAPPPVSKSGPPPLATPGPPTRPFAPSMASHNHAPFPISSQGCNHPPRSSSARSPEGREGLAPRRPASTLCTPPPSPPSPPLTVPRRLGLPLHSRFRGDLLVSCLNGCHSQGFKEQGKDRRWKSPASPLEVPVQSGRPAQPQTLLGVTPGLRLRSPSPGMAGGHS